MRIHEPACSSSQFIAPSSGQDIRDHLLEALEGAFHICASGNIIFDFVDKWRIWNAARVGRGIFAVTQISCGQSACLDQTYPTVVGVAISNT